MLLCIISKKSLALFFESLNSLALHLHCKQTLQLILSGMGSFKPKTLSLFISCPKLSKFMRPKRLSFHRLLTNINRRLFLAVNQTLPPVFLIKSSNRLRAKPAHHIFEIRVRSAVGSITALHGLAERCPLTCMTYIVKLYKLSNERFLLADEI